jgi:YVTN family beta-propeller protein
MSSRLRNTWAVLLVGLLACTVLLIFSAGANAAPAGGTFKVVHKYSLPGDTGWDYVKVDPDAHRLYVSHGTHMLVVDEDSGKVVGDIPDTMGIHGIALATDVGKGFTSNGGEATVSVVDLKTLKVSEKIKTTGMNPDNIVYDPVSKRVFTMNARSNNSTVIDAATDMVVGTVDLGGKPEEAAPDGKGNLFVNLEDKSSIMEFDTKSLAVKGTWPLAPCEGPSALAVDGAHRRLFVACDKVMVVVNADTGKVVASPPIGGDPDGDGFDPATGLAFASCREGLLSIIHEDSPDKYSTVDNVMTQFGARTMALDPKTHHIFTITADFKAAAAPTPDNPRPRPQQVPGTFVLLDIAQQ